MGEVARVARRASFVAGLCGGLLCSLLWGVAPAEAVIVEFDVLNHPLAGSNPRAFDARDWGMFLDYRTGWWRRRTTYFHFNSDTKLQVDTQTGIGTLAGTMSDLSSGDLWRLSGTLSGIRASGRFDTAAVPYDTMFQDLLNAGTGGGAIFYDAVSLSLSTDVARPRFAGSRVLGNYPRTMDKFDITYRKWLSTSRFPGSQYNLLGAFGWFDGIESGRPLTGGDMKINLANMRVLQPPPGPPVIPEPSTMLLFGLGAVGGLGRRRLARLAKRVRASA